MECEILFFLWILDFVKSFTVVEFNEDATVWYFHCKYTQFDSTVGSVTLKWYTQINVSKSFSKFQSILIRNELIGIKKGNISRIRCEQNKEFFFFIIINWQVFFVIWIWFESIWQHNEIAIKMFASHWCHRKDRRKKFGQTMPTRYVKISTR